MDLWFHSTLCRRLTLLCVVASLYAVSSPHSTLCRRLTLRCVVASLYSVSSPHSTLCRRLTLLCVVASLYAVSSPHSTLCRLSQVQQSFNEKKHTTTAHSTRRQHTLYSLSRRMTGATILYFLEISCICAFPNSISASNRRTYASFSWSGINHCRLAARRRSVLVDHIS
jgi:hypothetical protein